jgi:hypothetical protein
VSKPEITGYESTPTDWSSPPMPMITIDSEGTWVPYMAVGPDGRPYESTRLLDPSEIDGYMRYHGWKRVYRERPMRAIIAEGGYRMYCKLCVSYLVLAAGYLPHDYAAQHLTDLHEGTTR